MRLEICNMSVASAALRQWFDAMRRPEGSWAWFETLAATTLNAGEEALIASLVDSDGTVRSAVALAGRSGRPTRNLTAPYTTLLKSPLGTSAHAEMLGRLAAREVHATLRLDCLDTSDGSIAAFVEGLSQGGLVLGRYEHFANWFEEVPHFSTYWDARGSRLKSTIKRKTASLTRAHRVDFKQIDLTSNVKPESRPTRHSYDVELESCRAAPRFYRRASTKTGISRNGAPRYSIH